jgi:hypothetical protein
VRELLLALVAALALTAAALAPAASESDRTLSTFVLTQTLILSADSASIKRATTTAALGRAATRLGTDARVASRRVRGEKTSSSAGARCKRVALDTFARFRTAAASFTTAVTASKRGDRTAAMRAFNKGKVQLDAALGKLSTAAELAAALR